ncbi:unnamed protein product [Urochloa decumbens]|uniref:Uncharacterized protein n=1 Tax=Urochloa decumbens TaxID=240449 RepID=A0ABC9D7E5_9POAL
MAPKTAVLAILLVVSLVFADHVKCQQLGGSQGQQLVGNGSGSVDGGGGGGVSPNSNCIEKALYHGPCVDMFCAAACLVQIHRGGHCNGGFLSACLCFVCS